MLAQVSPFSCRTLSNSRAFTSAPPGRPFLPSARRVGVKMPVTCTAIMPHDLMEAARVTAFTGMACGGFVAGVELARQANQVIAWGRTMAPQSKAERRKDPVFLATLLALDIFLVTSMGLASAGLAHGLLSQVPPL